MLFNVIYLLINVFNIYEQNHVDLCTRCSEKCFLVMLSD